MRLQYSQEYINCNGHLFGRPIPTYKFHQCKEFLDIELSILVNNGKIINNESDIIVRQFKWINTFEIKNPELIFNLPDHLQKPTKPCLSKLALINNQLKYVLCRLYHGCLRMGVDQQIKEIATDQPQGEGLILKELIAAVVKMQGKLL